MQAVLEVTSGPHSGRKIVLSPGVPVRVGRTSKADYVVAEDTFLSGAHFYVEWSGEQCVVRDLSSSNGTFLNGTRLSEGSVHEGDIITAGQSSFALRLDAAGALTAMRPAVSLDETRPIPAPYYQSVPKTETEPPPLASAQLPPGAPPPPPYAGPSGFSAAPPAAAAAPAPSSPELAAAPLEAAPKGLLDVLRGLADPIFAVVDGTSAAPFIDAVRGSGGTLELLSENSGAWLAGINPDSRPAERLAADGWGRGWGIYVTSRQPLAIIRNHLRRFQVMLTQDGAEFAFRFQNPALMRSFLLTLSGAEAKAFFGPIGAILMEGNAPDTLMLFMPGPSGVLEKTLPLS